MGKGSVDKLKNFNNLVRIDSIRAFKLLEIIYYAIIGFLITLVVANILEDDNYMPFVFKTYDFKKASFMELLVDIIIDIVVLVLFGYYLNKLLACIPFIFSPLNKKYIHSFKGEVGTGIGIGYYIIIYTSLSTIKEKLKELDIRIKSILRRMYQQKTFTPN